MNSARAADVVTLGILARAGVVLGTVDEAHDVGILLDSARLTQVAQLRALAQLVVGGTRFDAAVELRQGDDGDVQLLGQLLEVTRNGDHLLLAAAELHTGGVHQLQVVDNDDFHAMFAHQAASLGPELKDGQRRRVVDEQRRGAQAARAGHQVFPLGLGELSALDFLALE